MAENPKSIPFGSQQVPIVAGEPEVGSARPESGPGRPESLNNPRKRGIEFCKTGKVNAEAVIIKQVLQRKPGGPKPIEQRYEGNGVLVGLRRLQGVPWRS